MPLNTMADGGRNSVRSATAGEIKRSGAARELQLDQTSAQLSVNRGVLAAGTVASCTQQLPASD